MQCGNSAQGSGLDERGDRHPAGGANTASAQAAVLIFLQACVLGALSVLIVDRACRDPLVAAEPSCATLFELCSDLEVSCAATWRATMFWGCVRYGYGGVPVWGDSVIVRGCGADPVQGYEDKAWTAMRREAAAKGITSLLQRDHSARIELMMMGGIAQILALLEAKVGGMITAALASLGARGRSLPGQGSSSGSNN